QPVSCPSGPPFSTNRATETSAAQSGQSTSGRSPNDGPAPSGPFDGNDELAEAQFGAVLNVPGHPRFDQGFAAPRVLQEDSVRGVEVVHDELAARCQFERCMRFRD